MYKVNENVWKKAYRPFDVVSTADGSVGYIREVNINRCQPNEDEQLSYAVCWMVGDENVEAWWGHEELTRHGNFMIEVAKNMTHSFGNSSRDVERLFRTQSQDSNERAH